jgi:para-aminobenzoate synthetase / 4-amino-4-deoxychorismate lyase
MRPSLPDPARGVFETMLVRAGRPVELAAHLERLHASAAALYREPFPDRLAELAVEGARGVALGRLRLGVSPNGAGRLRTDVLVARIEPFVVFPGWDRAVRLRGLVVEGGLGAHKWADRRLLAEAEAADHDAVPLVLDTDESVLEASRANVFVVEDGTIATPPADGRLLPGITRRRVLELTTVREEPLPLARLLAADEVFLTGSVRGIEPVHAYERVRVWRQGPVTAAVADALRERWEAQP